MRSSYISAELNFNLLLHVSLPEPQRVLLYSTLLSLSLVINSFAAVAVRMRSSYISAELNACGATN